MGVYVFLWTFWERPRMSSGRRDVLRTSLGRPLEVCAVWGMCVFIILHTYTYNIT